MGSSHATIYRTRMANSALKCRIIILITARSFCSYNNILINFGQLYSNSCYTTFSVATLGMCIACEFYRLWAVMSCIYHIFQHLTNDLFSAELPMQVRYTIYMASPSLYLYSYVFVLLYTLSYIKEEI